MGSSSMKLEAGVSVMPERHLLLAEEDDEGAEGADEPPWEHIAVRVVMTHPGALS